MINKVKLKNLIAGEEISVSGDGYNEDVVISASIVDNKPLIFLSYYSLKPTDIGVEIDYMQLSKSFNTLKAAKESLSNKELKGEM